MSAAEKDWVLRPSKQVLEPKLEQTQELEFRKAGRRQYTGIGYKLRVPGCHPSTVGL